MGASSGSSGAGSADPADTDLFEEFVRAGHAAGLVGDPTLAAHLENALLFDSLLPPAGRTLDLGSGAGLPGLILARLRPPGAVVLLDASARRCRFLEQWAARLAPGTTVLHGRAEDLARVAVWRHSFAAVTARAFGRPAVTAECAVGFVEPGGLVLVSEPPGEDHDRWPQGGLQRLGLDRVERVRRGSSSVQVLRCDTVVEEYPRSDGVPAQRPLF